MGGLLVGWLASCVLVYCFLDVSCVACGVAEDVANAVGASCLDRCVFSLLCCLWSGRGCGRHRRSVVYHCIPTGVQIYGMVP